MTPRDFCYWLQGLFELGHLALVFKHGIDAPDPTGVLQKIHDDGIDPNTVFRC